MKQTEIMITLNISCDNCRESEAFPLGTSKKKIYKTYHRIKKNDICSNCVTRAIMGVSFVPTHETILYRDLTESEKKKVIQYYDL